jgi:uncharacterized membrane protein
MDWQRVDRAVARFLWVALGLIAWLLGVAFLSMLFATTA